MCWLCNYNINFLFDFDTVLICNFSQSIKSVSTDNCQMSVLLYAGCTSQGVAGHNVLFCSPLSKDVQVCYHHHMSLKSCCFSLG